MKPASLTESQNEVDLDEKDDGQSDGSEVPGALMRWPVFGDEDHLCQGPLFRTVT